MEFCYYCGSIFCKEECYGAYEAEEYAIALHVEICTKEECHICQCM